MRNPNTQSPPPPNTNAAPPDPLQVAELLMQRPSADKAIRDLGQIVDLLKAMTADDRRASIEYLVSRFGPGGQ